MVAGDLTTGTITYADKNDSVAIAAAIDALNLALATDFLFVIPASGNQVAIFKVQRAV